MSRPITVYPVPGRWLHDVPAEVTVVETKAEAEALIATGAFTEAAPAVDPEPEPATVEPEPTPEPEPAPE